MDTWKRFKIHVRLLAMWRPMVRALRSGDPQQEDAVVRRVDELHAQLGHGR